MAVTLDMYLEAKRLQEIGWKPPVLEGEEALQKLGSPERIPPRYILAMYELEKMRSG